MNNRYLTYGAAGFLLNFAMPLPDKTIVTTTDIILANALVAIPFGLIGLFIAFLLRKRPQAYLKAPPVTVISAVLVFFFKLLRLDLVSLIFALAFLWSIGGGEEVENVQ